MNRLKHGYDWPHDKTCPYCDVERLERLVYLPGHWECKKCDFYLVSTNLHAVSGNFSANDKPHDCLNGCGPMWRVTHEQSANDMVGKVERLAAELSDCKKAYGKQFKEITKLLNQADLEQAQSDE